MLDATCTKCGETKSVDKFTPETRKKNGLSSWCKSCQRQAADNWSSKNPHRVLLHDIKGRCKKSGIPFDLKPEDIEIPSNCPVLGIPLFVAKGKGARRDNSPSIDRIVPEKGYVHGNVVVVSFRANRIKSNATADEILAVGRFYKELENE